MITLTVAGTDLMFTPKADDYAAYVGGVAKGDLGDASHNFVMQCAAEESKAFIRELAETNGGAMMQIAGAIASEFAPALDIKVKK